MKDLVKIPWYRRWFPYLPTWYYNPDIKVFTFQLWDCPVVHRHLSKIYFFYVEVLVKVHKKWWQPKYIGFSIWFPAKKI